MDEITLESLARRVEALEIALRPSATNGPWKDWRRVVGMFGERAFMREVDEECRRLRQAEREEARREAPPR